MAKKLTPVQEAVVRCKPAQDWLRNNARCMETTQDPAGILWERFVLENGTSVVLVSTPHWFDVFAPVSNDPRTEGLIEALKSKALERRA